MINQQRLHSLVTGIGFLIRDYLLAKEGRQSRERVYEVLNALAVETAIVLAGTGCDPEAIKFFLEALVQQLDDPLLEAQILEMARLRAGGPGAN